ncbi:hypothetical protein J6590_046880 [Homalodisca vitripennis]|nr:hypothetical protein J6590_046880 [Homalodisca vitripennis]
MAVTSLTMFTRPQASTFMFRKSTSSNSGTSELEELLDTDSSLPMTGAPEAVNACSEVDEPSLARSVSSLDSEDGTPCLNPPPYQETVKPLFIGTVNVIAKQTKADRKDVRVHIGTVTNITLVDCATPQEDATSVSCEPLLNEIVKKYIEPSMPYRQNAVLDSAVVYDTENNIVTSALGIQTKWYYLIITLVALSGTGCIVSAIVFSVKHFWPSAEHTDSQSLEAGDSTKGNHEEVIVLPRSWWYLILALVSVSCINLVSTAMFSINRYVNSIRSFHTGPLDIDTGVRGGAVQYPRLRPAVPTSARLVALSCTLTLTPYPHLLVLLPTAKLINVIVDAPHNNLPQQFLLEAPRMMSRSVWLAQPPTGKLNPNRLPVDTVIIGHTATEETLTLAECCNLIRNIQMNHIEARQWFDIGFSFLIGGDGSVYFGRGWDWQGAHTKGHNVGTLGIAMIGTFTSKLPNDRQMTALRKLLELGVKMKKIKENYSLITQCQLQHTWSPERKLAEELAKWPHFESSYPIM